MTHTVARGAGFAVVSAADQAHAAELAALVRGRRDGVVSVLAPATYLVRWGALAADRRDDDGPLVTVRGARGRARDLGPDDVRDLLAEPCQGQVDEAGDTARLSEVLPPFAAVGVVGGEVVVRVDWLGFRHVHVTRGAGWAAASSSAGVLGALRGEGLDREALASQAQLGWQTGSRTWQAGVRRLGPGERAALAGGRLRCRGPRDPRGVTTTSSTGTAPERVAAGLLRASVASFLDEHPDAILQLTGGLDSRILLAAVPPRRRPELEALTLVVPGSPDAAIAGRIAREQGMRHQLLHLDGLDALTPAEAWAQVREAAQRVDGAADPLGLAVLLWAERGLPARPRLAGLGGEVARGFYYVGPPLPLRVTPALAGALTRWRLTPNERVDPGAFVPGLAEAAAAQVADDVHAALAATGRPWWPATDELYLWERMGRWAGVLASATCADRTTVNPMLDRAFVDLARSVAPSAKQNMRLLSRILVELDPALALIGLDHRPPPVAYATRTWRGSAALAATQARRVTGKVAQRVHGSTRPPAGGEALRALVLEHWRAEPGLLDPARSLGVLREEWLDAVAAGQVRPAATTVSFLVNLLSALEEQAGGSGRPGQSGTSRVPQPSTAGRDEGRSSARTEARD
ncbi:asparagine synthase-related protein [Nocardioides sp. 1609]|uniref:asparagine synthase-related protein n=1 Tax=Nocardioides sp. 1609 TaxID=2508327 RepID=UPI00106F137A|nr:asparagine synthase-related protein [Nocardioides sp. 1609]